MTADTATPSSGEMRPPATAATTEADAATTSAEVAIAGSCSRTGRPRDSGQQRLRISAAAAISPFCAAASTARNTASAPSVPSRSSSLRALLRVPGGFPRGLPDWCQRRSKYASAGRSKNASLMVAVRLSRGPRFISIIPPVGCRVGRRLWYRAVAACSA
jgi:hypothetical protein